MFSVLYYIEARKSSYVPFPMKRVAVRGSFLTIWPDISCVGRVTSDVVRGISWAQFVGFGHIATSKEPIVTYSPRKIIHALPEEVEMEETPTIGSPKNPTVTAYIMRQEVHP